VHDIASLHLTVIVDCLCTSSFMNHNTAAETVRSACLWSTDLALSCLWCASYHGSVL